MKNLIFILLLTISSAFAIIHDEIDVGEVEATCNKVPITFCVPGIPGSCVIFDHIELVESENNELNQFNLHTQDFILSYCSL